MNQEIIEPTNKSHRILFTVITILLTAGVVGGSVWYGMNQITKEQNNKITELEKNLSTLKTGAKTETKKEEKTASVAKDETADWKTYTDAKYGFSFKYPKSGYSLKDSVLGDDSIEIKVKGDNTANQVITFNVVNDGTALSKESIEKDFSQKNANSIENYVISGENGFSFKYDGFSNYKSYVVQDSSKNKVYFTTEDVEDKSGLITKIISTIKVK